MSNDFAQRVQDELSRLEEEDNRLREQRELLAEQMARIRTAIEVYRQLMGLSTPPEAEAEERQSAGPQFGPQQSQWGQPQSSEPESGEPESGQGESTF